MNRSVIIATIIAVGVTGWIVSGQFGQPETVAIDADAQKSEPNASEIAVALRPKKVDPTQVDVQMFNAELRAQQIVVRGTTESIRTVTIKAETPGRVVAIYVEIGQRVKKGETLVKFAIKDRRAQLAEAEALIRQRQIE
ncbi:MAG: biotin/lipoyl-binding protein, partial [Sneathiella sp.]